MFNNPEFFTKLTSYNLIIQVCMVILYLKQKINDNDYLTNVYDPTTPLVHIAIDIGDIRFLRFLSNVWKCDMNAITDNDGTSLSHVIEIGNLDILKFLYEECKCPITKYINDVSPVWIATHHNHSHILLYLKETCNCEMNLPNIFDPPWKLDVYELYHYPPYIRSRETPLECADLNGYVECLKIILSCIPQLDYVSRSNCDICRDEINKKQNRPTKSAAHKKKY